MRGIERLINAQSMQGRYIAYLIAPVMVLLALLARLAVAPIGSGLQYITFFPAVTLVAVIAGFGPGMFAAFLGMCLATFIFTPPYFQFSLQTLQASTWSNIVFLFDGLIVCTVISFMQQCQRRAAAKITLFEQATQKLSSKEDEIRQQRIEYQQIIQTSAEGFWLCDQAGNFLEVNDSYCKMVGYRAEELLGMRIPDLEANESAAEVAEHMTKIFSTGHDLFETRHRCKNGELIDLEISVSKSAVRGDGLIVFVRDISQRLAQSKQHLAEVREQRDLLVREVHHRIKNHLQGLVGLLRQHAIDHPQMRDVIDVIVGRVYSIATIHGLQAESLTEQIDLDELMDQIISASGCYSVYENLLIQPVSISPDEAVPIALAINELVTNACKHRLKRSMLSIQISENENHVLILISNAFDAYRQGAQLEGQGLNLIRSLLPRKFSELTLECADNIYTAKLLLFAPVVCINGMKSAK